MGVGEEITLDYQFEYEENKADRAPAFAEQITARAF